MLITSKTDGNLEMFLRVFCFLKTCINENGVNWECYVFQPNYDKEPEVTTQYIWMIDVNSKLSGKYLFCRTILPRFQILGSILSQMTSWISLGTFCFLTCLVLT